MADLVIDPKTVAPIMVTEQFSAPSGAAVAKGQPVYYNSTTGRLAPADASAAGTAGVVGIALSKATPAGMTTTVVRKGYINLGNALDALNFGAIVYLSDTEGALADAAGTVSRVIGTVVPHFGATGTPDKVLRVDL